MKGQKSTEDSVNYSVMIICIVFFIIFSVFIYFLIKESLNSSVSKSEERYISQTGTGENSVQVDIITKNYYIKDEGRYYLATKETNGSRQIPHLIQTFTGKKYIYDEKELNCIAIDSDFDLEDTPKEKNAYAEIIKNSNHYYLVRYTKSVKRYRSARSGSSAYNIYYKSSQCSGIYPLIIIANKKS